MTWVLKVLSSEAGELPEYLHRWEVRPYDKIEPEWTTDQRFAYRFDARNHASEIAYKGAVQAYAGDDEKAIRIVKLVPKRTSPRITPEVLAALRSGLPRAFIEAIKTHRAQSGCGLKEAKDYIESLPEAVPALERMRAAYAPPPSPSTDGGTK